MFKWKIYYYSNINGKEQKIEKEFNNPNEYYNFINSHEELNPWNLLNSFNLDNYLENFFNSKFALTSPEYYEENTTNLLPEWVDISKYEEEAKKIDEQKQKQEEKKSLLEKSLEKLKWFLEKFKKENKKDLVEKVKKDIEKVENELKNL